MSSKEDDEAFFLQCIHRWYPFLHCQTYFLPPFHQNKVPFELKALPGTDQQAFVLLPGATGPNSRQRRRKRLRQRSLQPSSGNPSQSSDPLQRQRSPATQPSAVDDSGRCTEAALWRDPPFSSLSSKSVKDSDIQDDQTQQHVLFCLSSLAARRKDVMFVISNLRFENYLEDFPVRSAAAKEGGFPKTAQRGEFDVLIIHRKFGFVVFEIKSIRDCSSLGFSEDEANAKIAKRVEQAVRQLDKAQTVLDCMVSDLPPLCVTKVIALPNITRSQLKTAVDSQPALQQKLQQCLQASSLPEAISYCLCGDDLSPRSQPWTVTDTVLTGLQVWWTRSVEDRWGNWLDVTAGGSELGEEARGQLYEKLTARFCGPATRVDLPTVTSKRKDVRTVGEGVADTGLCMSRLCLYPPQFHLLETAADTVFLTGPPGTGKSVLLALKGLQWLGEGEEVQVVSTWKLSRAATFLLEFQLVKSLHSKQALSAVATAAALRVRRHSFNLETDTISDVVDILVQASGQDGGLHVLVDEAGPSEGTRFKEFCGQLMTRLPKVSLWAASVRDDLTPECLIQERLTAPLRCPPVVVREIAQASDLGKCVHRYTEGPVPPPVDGPAVQWLRHAGQLHHLGDDPRECRQCGVDIAHLLQQMDVGSSDSNALHYRDVLVLFCEVRDETTDASGIVTSRANDIIQGMRSQGVPVQVADTEASDDQIRDVALARRDEVVVADFDVVMGLERSVVIGVGDVGVLNDRLYSMSRCTAQLVWIDSPFPY